MSLEFYKQIFEDCLNDDGLVVMGSGLGVHNIILGFLKYYSDSSDLVLFLDCQSNESLQNSYLFYHERLLNFGIKFSNLPTMVNVDTVTSSTKTNMYSKGGVYFGPASIFVLDFLTKRMPCNLISGIIIQNAHRITDTSIEYLLIKLFRQNNKNGFIKAFTTEPSSLVDEIGKLQRTMKYLHLKKLFLWPRFHQHISYILDRHPPDLVELSIGMTNSMKKIEESLHLNTQRCISSLIAINKLPRLNSGGNDSDSFDQILKQQLKPIWSKLNLHSKQLVSSVRLLNQLKNNLLVYDCVTFYGLLLYIQASSDSLKDGLQTTTSKYVDEVQPWLESKEAQNLFSAAQERVYRFKKLNTLKSPPKKLKTLDNDGICGSIGSTNLERTLTLEDNPKWNVLYQILQEIEEDKEKQGTILIFVKDESTVNQLGTYLDYGGYSFLLGKYEKFCINQEYLDELRKRREENNNTNNNNKSIPSNNNNNVNGGVGVGVGGVGGYSRYRRAKNFKDNRKQQIIETSKKKKGKGSIKDQNLFNMGIQLVDSHNKLNIPNPKFINQDGSDENNNNNLNINDASTIVSMNEEINGLNEFYELLSPPYIVIHPISKSLTILDEIRPTFIIVYDPDISITRQIEVYKAENPGTPIRLYFMTYSDSSEEYQYVSKLQKEKFAFEKLIREKTNLIIDTEQEGKIQLVDTSKLELLEDRKSNYLPRNSRLGGLMKNIDSSGQQQQKTIIIDSHEFKSSLPVVLHNNGYEIIPLRLEVGDFVLSPIHCIERKSISDLIGSFNSGRLFTQIEAMNRVYKNPILLIEFDPNQPFYLVAPEELQKDYLSPFSLSSKLVFLTKSFPKLRVIWSRSYYCTTKIYDQIKDGYPEPDPSMVNVIPEVNEDQNYNFNAQDVLRTMPGVNDKNINLIMDNVEDLFHLSKLSLSELSSIMNDSINDNKNATLLFNFFNNQLNQ
ncbi:hypothetical protein RB653_001122 [Dictyostelium firmibasis]|uniref:ERCC4 domain-containing protein n=1 Tax=Dictyostelium firmibasis TaxID=79012 RepID=A0AAN7TWD9_9MYCE